MLTYNGQFEQELRKLVDAELARRLDTLANINAITTHSQYAYSTGVIAGLRMVADLCEEANTVMSER